MRQKAGAGGVVHIEKFAPAADGILLALQIVLVVLGREKGREMMVEPPGDAGRGRVLEIDDGVFVAGKLALVKERPGAMDEAVVFVRCACGDALAVEARKEGGRAGSVEAFVVIKHANLQA